MGLTRNQMFVKKEATAEDVALILHTLWQRAAEIPLTPIIRLSFHAMVLLATVGGFRPEVVEMLKYRQTSVQVVRHPKTGEKTTTVAFTLQQNKLQPHVIKIDQKDVYVFLLSWNTGTILD